MKNLHLILILIFGILAACSSQQEVAIKSSAKQEADSTEYELIVSETGFKSWFLTRSKPIWYYDEIYYEKWNEEYVRVWNNKVYSPGSHSFFSEPINYDFEEDYNKELDHELYYYFRYVEEELGHEILKYGPKKPVP